MPRTIVVGDIHGCIEEFNELLDKVDLQEDDRFISIGDLLHKGPNSPEVVKRLMSLKSDVILLLGNHEEKHLRWLDHQTRGTSPNPVDHNEEFQAIQNQLSNEETKFLQEESWLFRTIRAGSLALPRYLLVHGGIPYDLRVLPDIGFTYQEALLISSKERKNLMRVLRLRYETPSGRMVSLGQEKLEDIYWAERYDGRFGTVIFGHQPFIQEGPRYFPHAIGIDNGCVHGGWLTALVFEDDKQTSISIKAKKTYSVGFTNEQ